MILLQCDSRMVGHWIEAKDRYEGQLVLRTPWLKPGSYRVDLFICNAGMFDKFEDACRLNVIPLLPYPAAGNADATGLGGVFADFSYEERHSGVEPSPLGMGYEAPSTL
jgi:lipopolysaccharide transport system ATP-binding protein